MGGGEGFKWGSKNSVKDGNLEKKNAENFQLSLRNKIRFLRARGRLSRTFLHKNDF